MKYEVFQQPPASAGGKHQSRTPTTRFSQWIGKVFILAAFLSIVIVFFVFFAGVVLAAVIIFFVLGFLNYFFRKKFYGSPPRRKARFFVK